MNNQKCRPGIPFYLTLCGRAGRAGESCGRVRPARRPISRLCLTTTHKHTHIHTHRRQTLPKTAPQNGSKTYPKPVAKSAQNTVFFSGKVDFHRREKNVALGRQHRREKKLLWQPFHVLEVALLTWRLYLVAFVCPCTFLSRVVPANIPLYLQPPRPNHKNTRLV